MTVEDFVAGFLEERESLKQAYIGPEASSSVAAKIKTLRLDPDQTKAIEEIVSEILTDSFYSILLGLDGAASIGSAQETYEIRTEDGTLLTGSGLIEAEAYRLFHGG